VQRLVVAYVLAMSEDAPTSGDSDLVRLIKVATGLKQIEGADRLAALAYHAGDYEDARLLADQLPGPLASWVKAKLALQRGNLEKAAAFYAEAVKAFPPTAQARVLDDGNLKLLPGETGVLALARGEYLDAFAILYQLADTYWGDAAYVAERVLTTDQLRQFVDARVHVPTSIQPVGDEPFVALSQAGPAAQLRDLLGRRLVREGHYSKAIEFLEYPDVRKKVSEYSHALEQAKGDWRRINRARHWYEAAVLARTSGMEMMGSESAPDYFGVGGNFDEGIGQSSPGSSLVTDGERSRFAASATDPDKRFHYRYIAVEQAEHAGDLLPPRSQAFAAVLCKATGWMLSSHDDAAAHRLYHRYVKEGPYVRWAVHFGHSCPEPDFDEAARLPRILLVRHTRHFIGRYRWGFGLALTLAILAGAAMFIRLRHRKL
jgi:hypothetical protein